MIRTVGQVVQFEEDEPVPPRDVVSPVMGSTPVVGHENEKEKVSFPPLTAPKKKTWVPAKPIEQKSKEGGNESSGSESSTIRRSPLSAVSSGKRRGTEEDEIRFQLRPPGRYDARATRVQVQMNERKGLREISATEEGDDMLTGGGGGGDFKVRRVTARSWLEGGEIEEEGGL